MMNDNLAFQIAMHGNDAYRCFIKHYMSKGDSEEQAKLKANQIVEEAYAYVQERLDQEMRPRKRRGT